MMMFGRTELLFIVTIIAAVVWLTFMTRETSIDDVVSAAIKVDGKTYYYVPMPNCESGIHPPETIKWNGSCWVAVMDLGGNLVHHELDVE
jgi:hypothetical protein